MWNLLCIVVLVSCLTLIPFPVSAQESDPVATWQALVNQARLDEGLAPYGFSSLLTAAAQRHADDLAAHEIWSHTGSDGSTPRQRIAGAGYAGWTWNSGELIASENFWTGQGSIEDAMAFFLEDPPHRENILSTTYREIGIGVATDAARRNYHVLDFGVRPNVLPIFVNDGAGSTDDPQIAIRLTNEEARPSGEGATFMGRAIEIRISGEPDFGDRPWQPWEPLVPWTLPATSGQYTVYVQFRDAAGRTAASADTIFLGEGTPTTPTSVPPSPTAEPSATPAPTDTPIPPSPPAESTAAPTAIPTSELPPTAEPPAPPPSPTPPPATMVAPAVATPFPTWTPLPTPVPQETGEPEAPLFLLAALQGIALTLGIYLVLRRGQRRQEFAPPDDRAV
jgi:uncharacterized protein YkwD